MKKFICTFLILSLTSTSLCAQEAKNTPAAPTSWVIPSPDAEDDPVPKISPMRKGDEAPFTGILFSPRATATMITEIETIDQKIAIEVQKAVKDSEAKKQFEINEVTSKCITSKTTLQAAIEANEKKITKLKKDLQDAQDAANNTPSRVLWAGLGIGAGAIVTVLITFAVNQASK